MVNRVALVLFLALSSLFTVTPAHADDIWWAQENWENQEISIVAPDGWEFAYVKGWYGDPNNWNCGYDITDKLGELVLGQTAVTFYADNNTFGDSCSGTYKVLRLTWGIVPVSIIVEPPIIEPPVIEPTSPPIVDPPVIDPPIVEPPVVDPPVVVPPVVDPPIVEPPIVVPPIVEPTDPTPIKIPISEPIVEPLPDLSEHKFDVANLDPQKLSDAEVVELIAFANAILDTASPGDAVYEQALQQLFIAAQADDIVVDEQIANVPLLGDTVVALAGVVNYLGNVGSDMSPKARSTAKKEVVAAVVLTQIATSGAILAGSMSAGGSSVIRRKL
jgi:hypothetical protein